MTAVGEQKPVETHSQEKNWFLPWKKPVILGSMAYITLRLWNSLVLLLLNFFPPGVVPSDPAVRETLFRLQDAGWFSHFFLAPWYRWDTVYYLEIAGNGYSRPFLTVWPPLYPALVHLVSELGIPPMVSAILVSNLSAILVCALLYRIAEELSPGWGVSSVRGLLLFPTAFFLVAGYSESLFLVCAAAAIWMAHRGRFGWAGVWAMLAALTRLQGVILAVPIFYEWWIQHGIGLKKNIGTRKLAFLSAISGFLPVLVTTIYVLYVKFGLGFAWPWETLALHWGQHTGWPLEGVAGNFSSLLGLRQLTTPINPLAQGADLILLLIAIASLVLIPVKKLPIPFSYQIYAWLGLGLLLIKVDNQGLLVSASRYILGLFPVFFSLAGLLQKIPSRWKVIPSLVLGLTSQAILLVCFSWWIWVA